MMANSMTRSLNALLLLVRSLLILFVALAVTGSSAWAENPGQADLDEATIVKLRAKTEADWEKAIELCESAIKKGLDKDSEEHAKLLLTSTLYGRAARRGAVILNPEQRFGRAASAFRKQAMEDLDRVLKYDKDHGNAHLLVARLAALPQGDRERGRTSAKRAFEILEEPALKSEALFASSELSENEEDRTRLLDEAIKVNARNSRALRMRGVLHIKNNNVEAALENFEKLLEVEPNDLLSNQMIAQLLTSQKKFNEALSYLDKAIGSGIKAPQMYYLKAQILNIKGDKKDAIKSADEALKVGGNNPEILLFVASLRIDVKDYDLASNDLKKVLGGKITDTQRKQAYLIRSLTEAGRNRYDLAVRDIERLLVDQPENSPLQLQLALFLERDKRHTRAIAVVTEVIEREAKNVGAYQQRGDLFLTTGRHDEAVEDYERALEIAPDNSGVLNNLAWVLATSPKDDIRDGKRSIELAKKACDVTEFKAAHIISTLAAGHAEAGNFEKAIEWSTKAVEMNKDEEQLANELASYQNGKPWRERSTIEEKPEPEEPSDNDLDFLDDDLDDEELD